jgi:hypothetical protein
MDWRPAATISAGFTFRLKSFLSAANPWKGDRLKAFGKN